MEKRVQSWKERSKEQQGSYTENHVCLIIKAMQKGWNNWKVVAPKLNETKKRSKFEYNNTSKEGEEEEFNDDDEHGHDHK